MNIQYATPCCHRHWHHCDILSLNGFRSLWEPEAFIRRCSVKIFFRKTQKIHWKIPAMALFLVKLEAWAVP